MKTSYPTPLAAMSCQPMHKTLLILLITILFGCKKDVQVDETTFPITFYAEQATVVSDTKVYVKGGLLNDPQKTKELMWIYSRHFKLEQELQNAGERFLSFTSKDSVSFFNDRSPYLITRNGDMLTMTSTIQFMEPVPFLQDQLYDYVSKYQNKRTDGDAVFSRDIKIAYGSGYKELKVPMFAYVTSSGINGPVNRLNRRGGLVVNEFNAEVINRIGDRDTIIVKTYMLTVKTK